MNKRRNFLRFASAAALPAAAAIFTSGTAKADDGDGSVSEFLGAWDSVHSLPGGATFREFLTFADGGVLHETNNFINFGSNGNPAVPGVMYASDGMGSWKRVRRGVVEVVFRKMLFDFARQNFADLRAIGTLTSNGVTLDGVWKVELVSGDTVLGLLGDATSHGRRMS
jgi:hypothetical protein